MPLGRWKNDRERKIRFIGRALRYSEATQNKIAQRAGTTTAFVRIVNNATQIRDRAETLHIKEKARIKMALERTKPRTNYFSAKEKEALLKTHVGLINFTLNKRRAWVSTYCRTNRITKKEFMADLMSYLWEKLNYFDPAFVGKSGKPTTAIAFLARYTEYFCHNSAMLDKKRNRFVALSDRIEPVHSHAHESADHVHRKTVNSAWALLSKSARTFLRKLGLDVRTVGQPDFESIQNQLENIIRNPENRFPFVQRAVLLLRVRGIMLKDIAQKKSCGRAKR